MIKHKLLFILISVLALKAYAQEARPDLLGPLAQCVNSDGFHDERKDRLPSTTTFRTIKLAEGPAKVSTVDGYRLMVYRKSSSPLVNLKIEQSAKERFADDRALITKQMQEIAADSKPPHQITLETRARNGIEILALNNPIDQAVGVASFYTLMEASTGTVATAYILTQKLDARDYSSDEE